ncbi:hypothetical protein BGX31_001626 [Mortierella sp. GBA43]|nr:hypothetical protein BGX31_001626 [Mortierella sp. GBA43]
MNPQVQLADWAQLRQKNPQLLLKEIQNNIIASSTIANPLFGKKKSIYTDFFASSKPLRKFESTITETVLPFYANTHTSTTSTSKSTSASVKMARETIARCTNAISTPGHEHQAAVVYCGDGSTSAINKIRNVFRLNDEAYWIRKALAESDASSSPFHEGRFELPTQYRPVVFLSIQEHHSNLLPWRESCADVVVIPENPHSHRLDLDVLEQQLILYQHRPLKLGTFSAGSNLTGVLNDTVAISELLHKYDAFAFYDYAGVGPYTTIDMNPTPSQESDKNLAYKDGVFISTHKFLGGPGASGVLVARLKVFEWVEEHNSSDKNEYIPAAPGGGTVDMVLPGRHKYIHNVLAREEAGTPNILATIRTGLVFRLQEIVDPAWILQKEYKLAKRIMARLMAPEFSEVIRVLGGTSGEESIDRVAVFSLTMSVPRLSVGRQEQGKVPLQIHHALLSTIMNDFFGVEMRGGCMCAGPYASQLLGFDSEREDKFWRLLIGETGNNHTSNAKNVKDSYQPSKRQNIHQQDLCSKSLKPGFVRFSFSYFAKEKDVEFVVQSLEWVAKYGYLLIPLYQLDARSGEWSIREAVHKAVYAYISPKYKKQASREYCIPAAVECIYGLQKVLQEQAKSAGSSEADHSQTPQQDVAEVQESGSRVFYSIGHARKSLANLLSHVLHRPKADSTPSLVATPPESPTKSSDDDAHSMIMHGDHERDNHDESYVSGLSRRLPVANISSSDVSTISSSSRPSEQHQRGSVTIGSTVNNTRASSKLKNSSVPAAKDRQTLVNAWKELSWDRLQAEVDAVETSDLAKELRWFVTPLDVVQFYVQELSRPSEISPFPRR